MMPSTADDSVPLSILHHGDRIDNADVTVDEKPKYLTEDDLLDQTLYLPVRSDALCRFLGNSIDSCIDSTSFTTNAHRGFELFPGYNRADSHFHYTAHYRFRWAGSAAVRIHIWLKVSLT